MKLSPLEGGREPIHYFGSWYRIIYSDFTKWTVVLSNQRMDECACFFIKVIPANKWGRKKKMKMSSFCNPNELLDLGNNQQWLLVSQMGR